MPASHVLLDGTRITDHWVEVPLDWRNPDGESLRIYAREFIGAEVLAKGEVHAAGLPYLLFLQGGPGGKGNRPAKLGGWMAELAKDFRIIMLDQRGTGLSSRLDRHSLSIRGNAQQQAAYLRHFRADSIVRDAEALREQLGIRSWSVFGQSYGGFCTLTYLSFAPQHLDRALITGGLAPLSGPTDRVYRHTYQRMAARNEEHFSRFPRDRELLDAVISYIRTHDARLLDGSPLTVPRLQMLGMSLGGNTKADSLHYLLEEAFTGDQLSDTFLGEVGQRISFAGNPMYAVMHESIYGLPGEPATAWAAERVLAEFPEFSASAEQPLLTGEMIFREHLRLDPVLAPLHEAAEALAAVDDWDALYDLDQLGRNQVPAAACVYTDDVFVDRELSLETAGQVANLSVYETAEYHHDGIHDDGPAILRELLRRTERAGGAVLS
ncbi:alpha/beta fold hydrolase [Nesterenkonia alkaliphila]|uniref:Alpha/beta fold hydrolase n=1 Tax=Nesterenkonia alkaliphila TaxID=1463631 RepID=A0A7K1UHI6_9MICC|nr:alpha/beta fold hydrolase [Nesterenkonia alkaliphila]MVT25938.1 alpha/beta fold hydrolase [Nesterenkonia alkaliphila]GFZ99301.1 alpha/beta hydrolase [Nesterenkonia alkaliphila]